MADKSSKPKKSKKTAKAQPSVLGSLPATRPDRFGRREPQSTPKSGSTTTPKAAANPSAAAQKSNARTTKRNAAKPRATNAQKAAPAQPQPRTRPVTPPPPPPPRSSGPPSGPQLVTTAIQAVGELAQIGASVGGQVLKRAARRLPRP